MSAYEELTMTGSIGREGVPLLYRTVAAVARFHHFPPPSGHSSWTTDAVTEVAHDFLTARPGTDRIRQLFLLSTDEVSFQALLHQAIRNHLRSIARRSDFGALMRRVRDVLQADARFTRAGDTSRLWTLVATESREPYTGQPEALVEAAWTVKNVRVVRWKSETRRGPYADRDSIARICERLLQAHPTAMSLPQLTRAVAARLNVGEPPLVVELDDELAKPLNGSYDDGPANQLLTNETAASIWRKLTEREKILLPVLDESVRNASERVGIGKSQAGVSMKRIRSLIDEECADGGDRGEVARRLQDIADDYLRTTEYGGAY